MKISFCDFWDGFDNHNNFFTQLLKSSDLVFDIVDVIDSPDVIFYSCFGELNKHFSCKKIFFTGENFRPDINSNYSITFDYDIKNNIRMPLWYMYIDWFNVGSYGNPGYLIPLSYLNQPNEFSIIKKNEFCVFMSNKAEYHRVNMFNTLNKRKRVDSYGSVFNNMGGKLGGTEKDKLEIISKYRFSIAFENSSYPGYNTEKLLHAKVVGNIPLYWGDPNIYNDMNPEAFLNFSNYKSFEEMVEHVMELENNPSKRNDILNKPLFKELPTIDLIKNQLLEIL